MRNLERPDLPDAFLEKGEANPDLLYSEVLKLDIRDDEAPWMLWAGLPNEMFTSRTEVRDARIFVTGALSAPVTS
jgi:hypothetical protein